MNTNTLKNNNQNLCMLKMRQIYNIIFNITASLEFYEIVRSHTKKNRAFLDLMHKRWINRITSATESIQTACNIKKLLFVPKY